MKTGRKKTKLILIMSVCICSLMLMSCSSGDTYKLAKKINNYNLSGTGYEETLAMAKKGNYDANCRDCFKGIDTRNVSLFALACEVDIDIAKAIYDNGADIEVSNAEFEQSPLLAAVSGNRNNTEIVYWLIDRGANINAVDYDNCCVFNYLRYWENNENTQKLITYFIDNCDMQYLKDNTADNPLCSWDKMWSEDNEFNFYAEYTEAEYDEAEVGTAVSIIGGADGPTSIFMAGKLGSGDEGYMMITMDEAKTIFEVPGDYIILDVRRADEFAEGHIPGAINIANEAIADTQPSELPDMSQTIYVYCRSGNRSKQAAEKLVNMGYTNIIEFGGIIDWTGEIER